MPWIGNYSFTDIYKGLHHLEPGRTVLIRIADVAHMFEDRDVKHFKDFASVMEFNFQDNEDVENGAMVESQARNMADFLRRAFADNQNVVVHCHAGLCRSGAVTDAGVAFGFQDAETFRTPNLHVKKLLFKHLGLINSWDQEAEEKAVQELTAKHFFTTTGGILCPREDEDE
jgi:predicted protein tyrosine phosphatase